MDLPDFREPRDTVRDRGPYGVSAGVGRAGSDGAGPVDSSSVSHTAMVVTAAVSDNHQRLSFSRQKSPEKLWHFHHHGSLIIGSGECVLMCRGLRETLTAIILVDLDQAVELCFKVRQSA